MNSNVKDEQRKSMTFNTEFLLMVIFATKGEAVA